MASAWGSSWGSSWGNSWGVLAGGGGGGNPIPSGVHTVLTSITFANERNLGSPISNYQTQAGVLVADSLVASLMSSSMVTGDAVASIANETDATWLRPVGTTNVLKVAVTSPGTVSSVYMLEWTINETMTTMGRFDVPIYSDLTNWTGVAVTGYFMVAGSFQNRAEFNLSHSGLAVNTRSHGWDLRSYHRDDLAFFGTATRDSTYNRVRILLQFAAGSSPIWYVGPIHKNRMNRPKIVFSFDDGVDEQYTNAFSYMRPRNVPGSLAINTGYIGSAARLTTTQLQEMHAAGWSVHNHTDLHADLTVDTFGAGRASVVAAQTWLAAQGLTRGAKTLITPNGADTADIRTMVTSLGYTHMAPTGGQQVKTWDGLSQAMSINRRTLDGTVFATNKASINQAIKYGTALVFFGHNINATPGSGVITIADFQATVDYAAQLRDDNILDIVSLQGLIDGLADGLKYWTVYVYPDGTVRVDNQEFAPPGKPIWMVADQ